MLLSKASLLTLASAAATISAVSAAEKTSDVLDLVKSNFTSSVDPESLILVEFFAPWCGHCQALAPHYEEAATELKSEGIKLAKVDCVDQADLCSEQDVGGYPTLKVFRNGKATPYAGPRKTDGIVSYMKKQALPSVTTLTAADHIDFQTKDKVVVISYVSEKDTKDLGAFKEVAETHRDNYLFATTSDEAAIEAAGVKAPAIVLYRKFDEPSVKYTGKFDSTDIEAFVKTESIPLIDEVGPDNFQSYAEAGLPLAYYFTQPDGANKEADLEKLKPIAKANKGKLNFVWIDAVKFINHARGLNLQGEEWPAFAIQDIEKATKYPLENLGKDASKSIGDFVKKFNAGSLKPSIKSEPVPSSQDGPVFVLVADEFDKVVFDDKKDALVEFYAPWCGHCKKLAPTYDNLGEKYASHKDKIVIAKMDATTNDVPPSAGFQVQSFPTIKFKKAGTKDWIDFDGERSLDGFVDFITLNAKNKVDVNLTDATEEKKEEPVKKDAPVSHEEL